MTAESIPHEATSCMPSETDETFTMKTQRVGCTRSVFHGHGRRLGGEQVVRGAHGCFLPHAGAVERHFELARLLCGDGWGWVTHTSVASFEADRKYRDESGSVTYG